MKRSGRAHTQFVYLPAAVLVLGAGVPNAMAQRTANVERVKAAFGLSTAEVAAVHPRATQDGRLEAAVPIRGLQMNLELHPHSVRSPGYRVMAINPDGSRQFVEPGPVTTYRGSVRGWARSAVAASLNENGLHARILLANGDEWWLEPVAARLPDAAQSSHVIYRSEDLLQEPLGCEIALATDAGVTSSTSTTAGATVAEAAACGSSLCIAEIAADADYEFFVYWGGISGVEDRINAIVNAVNLQYERDVNIRHVLTTIVVRSDEPDPYSSTDARTLLDEFRNHWLANHGDVQRDVAQLFSGKEFDGGTIGIAWLNAVCGSTGFSIVESNFSTGFSAVTDLSAHELGHNWSAGHCSCTNYTMNSYLTASNQFNPDVTIPSISSYRDSLTCLDSGVECFDDLDCDDGLFCTGVERCSFGLCESSGAPCPGEDCDEASAACVPRICNENGLCENEEDCTNCPTDCISGAGGVCGNGVCEIGAGEDCVNCPHDCNGVQNGNPSGRFCCGNGGANPLGCVDARCTQGSFECTETPGTPSCCGDDMCNGVENVTNCPLDCAVPCATDQDCAAPDLCTVAWCDAGFCTVESLDCDDGNACTRDVCSDGVCQAVEMACDDNDACSVDVCDPASGCDHQFPACGIEDGCCGPDCTRADDVDCVCRAKNEPCWSGLHCCSGKCKPNGRCR